MMRLERTQAPASEQYSSRLELHALLERIVTHGETDFLNASKTGLNRCCAQLDIARAHILHELCRNLQQPYALLDMQALHPPRTSLLSPFSKSAQLKKNAVVFDKLNKLIGLLQETNKYFQSADSRLIIEINRQLNELIHYYTNFRDEFINADQKHRETLAAPRILAHGFWGCRYLGPTAEYQFASYFCSEIEEAGIMAHDRWHAVFRPNTYGGHKVVYMAGVYYKINPEMPGIEYAVCSLNHIITGQGVAPTELLIFEKSDGSRLPVLASKSVVGINLNSLMLDGSANFVIEDYNFSSQVIMALLVRPWDGKPDNFMAKPVTHCQYGNAVELVSVDNDLAYRDMLLAGKRNCSDETQDYTSGLRSIVLCFPQMDAPIEPRFRAEFLRQHPVKIVMQWLGSLLLKQREYMRYRELFSAEELNQLHIYLRLEPGTAILLYHDLLRVQNILRARPSITHQELFAEFCPLLAAWYARARTAHRDLFSVYQQICAYKTREEIRSILGPDSGLVIQLDNCNRTQREFEDALLFTQNIRDACVEFINSLDFQNLDRDLQQYVLHQIIINFPFIENLTLRNCQILDDENLELLSRHLPELQELCLINCISVNGDGLSALVLAKPGIRIILDNFAHITAYHLLHVMRHCKYLSLRMGEHFYNVSKFSLELFYRAQELGQQNLIDCLLMYDEQFLQEGLYQAVRQGYENQVRHLLECGAVITGCDRQGRYILDYVLAEAIKPGVDDNKVGHYWHISALLLAHGAIGCRNPNEFLLFMLPFLEPCKMQYPDLPRQLLLFACNYNILDSSNVGVFIDYDVYELDLSCPPGSVRNLIINARLIEGLAIACPNLRQLNICGCGFNEPANLAASFSRFASLERLLLSYTQARELGLVTVTDNTIEVHLSNQRGVDCQIINMDLGGNKLSLKFVAVLANFLQHNITVRHLDLYKCDLDAEKMALLGNALVNNAANPGCCLEILDLNGNSLTVAGMQLLEAALGSHPSVTFLNLNNCNIDEKGAEYIGRILKTNNVLRKLSLQNNPLGGRGAEFIADGLTGRNTEPFYSALEELDVNETGIDDQGARAMALILHRHKYSYAMPNIRILDIGHNLFGDPGLAALLAAVAANDTIAVFKYGGLNLSPAMQQESELNYRTLQAKRRQERIRPYLEERRMCPVGQLLGQCWEQRAEESNTQIPPDYNCHSREKNIIWR